MIVIYNRGYNKNIIFTVTLNAFIMSILKIKAILIFFWSLYLKWFISCTHIKSQLKKGWQVGYHSVVRWDVEWVALMDMKNLNSMIYHYTRKIILSGNTLSDYITELILWYNFFYADDKSHLFYF